MFVQLESPSELPIGVVESIQVAIRRADCPAQVRFDKRRLFESPFDFLRGPIDGSLQREIAIWLVARVDLLDEVLR